MKLAGVPGPEPTEYVYRLADGTPYLKVQRTGDKRFWQSHWTGSTWATGKPAGAKVPYRLPELLAAVHDTVFVVEGEKDADRLASLGFVATTASEGAGKWSADLNSWFAGKTVHVIADNDDPGARHAQLVAASLSGVAAEVRIVSLPGLAEHGDVSDWLDAGGDTAELVDLCLGFPLYEAEDNSACAAHDYRDLDATVERLKALSPVAYDRERKTAAEGLGIRVSTLDKLVLRGSRPEDDTTQGRPVNLPDPEPWPDPVNGADLLGTISAAIRRHVVMSDHAVVAVALWVMHTHLIGDLPISPRLAITSPEKGCGKTTLLDVLHRLVSRPVMAANVTASAIFRLVEIARPTLLIDEADTFLAESEALRGVLNSGHRQDGGVIRNVGENFEPRLFSTFSPCAIATIGKLPATLTDRSIPVNLTRRRPNEVVEPFRFDRRGRLDEHARQAARWAKDNAETISTADPDLPAALVNRAADNWRHLIAIADAAGGDWPSRARLAAIALAAEAGEEDQSAGVDLLRDIRSIFTERSTDRLASTELVNALVKMEERQWAEWKAGKPITHTGVARLLSPFGIKPRTIRIGEQTPKGYHAEWFEDAFVRYLPRTAT